MDCGIKPDRQPARFRVSSGSRHHYAFSAAQNCLQCARVSHAGFCGLSILIGRSGIERLFNAWDPSPESTIPSQSGQGIELELVRSGQSALMATKLQAGVEGRENLIVRSCQFFTKVLCEPVRHV